MVPTDGAVVLDNTTEKWSVLPGECEHTPTGEGTVIKASTCTENGETSYVCSKCGKTYNVTVVAEGHNYEGANAVCSCGAKATFTVAGDNTDLFGTEWDAGNTKNSMTFNEETHTWSISYVNNSSSEIWPNFKVCLDHGWNTCWGGAAAGQTDSDNAWATNENGAWHSLTDKDNDGVWELAVPDGCDNVIFVDFVADTTEPDWSAKRAQTSDLKIPTDSNVYYHADTNTWSDKLFWRRTIFVRRFLYGLVIIDKIIIVFLLIIYR